MGENGQEGDAMYEVLHNWTEEIFRLGLVTHEGEGPARWFMARRFGARQET
jgi:hypothetical protein